MTRKQTLGLLLLWAGLVMIAAGLTNLNATATAAPTGAPADAARSDTAAAPTVDAAYMEANLLRLHVIANSDSDADQALKRAVRDAILAEVTPLFTGVQTRQEAEAAVAQAMPRIEQVAAAVIKANGQQYPVKAVLGQFDFPARTYGDMFVPAGRYTALRVLIGEAKGANWWCVLFPPMCFLDWSTGVVLEPKPGSGGTQTVTVPRNPAPLLVDEDTPARQLPVRAHIAIVDWAKREWHHLAR